MRNRTAHGSRTRRSPTQSTAAMVTAAPAAAIEVDPMPGLLRGKYATAAWILLMCVISQLPFWRIWAGGGTFPYDAATSFSYFNVARLAALRSGEGFLGFFQVGVPFEVWPSYYFTGLIRQVAALIQPNTASAHAMLQALHGALLVPAVALLLRSFGVPARYGAVGGLVYALAGIHASLTQHVYSHEALVYLVLSLWSMREFALGISSRPHRSSLALLLGCGLVLTSLVRVHHEAIIYMPPMLLWALYHLWAVRNQGRAAVVRVVLGLAALAVFVAVSSVPMLMATYDLSLTNKTEPLTYERLVPYFSDPRVFGLAFALPEFAGELSGGPSPHNFGTDSTLAYTFFGTLSTALYLMVLILRARDGRWKDVASLVILPVVVLSYAFGPGNVLHRAVTLIFPFLVGIGHSFYGLHLFYLLVAFGVAEGLRQLITGRGEGWFVGLQAAFLASVLYFCVRAVAQAGAGWGLNGSLNSFAASIQDDTRYAALLSVAATAVLAATSALVRIAPAALRRGTGPVVILFGFTALIAFDLVRPLVSARFMPVPVGDVPAEQIAGYIERTLSASPRGIQERAFVVGGWRANALLPLDVDLIQMPGDSGGNRFVSRVAQLPPSEALISTLVQHYGATVFWAERSLEDWHRMLAASPQLEHGFHAEWGGDVYWVKRERMIAPPGLAVAWNSPELAVTDGLVRRVWQFPVTGGAGTLSLPLMWHPGYRVATGDGRKLDYGIDAFGRVQVRLDSPAALVVEYPNRILTALVVLSATGYLAWLLSFVILVLGLLRSHVHRRRGSRQAATPPSIHSTSEAVHEN